MQNARTLKNTNKKTLLQIAQFVIFVAIVTVAPLIKQQMIVGPLVNATLFISAAVLGPASAIMIGMIPSVIALSAGLLPAVLAPMVPFIILGNAILVSVFSITKKKNFLLGVITASAVKFLFLYFSSSLVVNLLLKKEVASKVAAMMSWPQFLTALIGGIIAFLLLKATKYKAASQNCLSKILALKIYSPKDFFKERVFLC